MNINMVNESEFTMRKQKKHQKHWKPSNPVKLGNTIELIQKNYTWITIAKTKKTTWNPVKQSYILRSSRLNPMKPSKIRRPTVKLDAISKTG